MFSFLLTNREISFDFEVLRDGAENLGGGGEQKCSPLVEIGLTDLPKYWGWRDHECKILNVLYVVHIPTT